jgi:hypothetical protein
MHDEHLNHRYNRVIRLEGKDGADVVYDGVCFTAFIRSTPVGIVSPRPFGRMLGTRPIVAAFKSRAVLHIRKLLIKILQMYKKTADFLQKKKIIILAKTLVYDSSRDLHPFQWGPNSQVGIRNMAHPGQ